MNENDVKEISIEAIKDIAPKLYDDMLSPSTSEVGEIGKNVIKTIRFLFAGFDIVAAYQDRFQK